MRWLAAIAALPLLAASPRAEMRRACSGCHPLDVVRVQRLTRGEWDVELTKMEVMGTVIRDRSALLDYLARAYGPRVRRRKR